MQKFAGLLLLLIFTAGACKQDTGRNPYLPDVRFEIRIDLNLPRYQSLLYSGNALYVADGGIKGVLVFNTGSGYNAFEASDPNHSPNDCSTMQLQDRYAVCPCEENTYSLYDGHPVKGGGKYGMKPYHTDLRGTILYIYN